MRNQIALSIILFLFVSSACTLSPVQAPAAQIGASPIVTEPQQHTIYYAFSRSYESDNEIALTGFELNDTSDQLTVHWQALTQPHADYTAFLHLISTAGEVAAQIDQMPDAELPTSQWQPNQYVVDKYVLDLAQLTPGSYLLVIGLYDQESGQRLHTAYSNAVTLAFLTVGDAVAMTTIGPDCKADGERFACRDEVLGIDFAYPLVWGLIEPELRLGGYAGIIYTYRFESSVDSRPIAGGLSADFSEGRGGWYTDFKGYGAGSAAQVCANYSALCEQIAPNVLLMIIDAPVDFLCEPGPGTLAAPKVAVALNFAPARPVQGFIFLHDFLANGQVSRLHEIVDFDGNSATNCTEETKNAYNNTMQQIIHEIQNGSSDVETQGNFQAMLDLAKSVTVNP